MIETPYLSVAELMQYLRLPARSTVYYLINEQRLPSLRRGGRYLFDRREIDAWLRGTDALSLARARKQSA